MTTTDINYNFYALAFIDILGQKEAFKDLDGQELRDNHPKLIEAHKKTVMFVENLRKGFENYFDAYTNGGETSAHVHPSKLDQFKAMMKSNLKHQRFSDSIQAYASLHSDRYHCNAVNGVFGILMACGSLLLLSLSLKKVFRAGIEVGIGIELDNGEIYGPVLYKAYELESKVAEYPRIVIGKELINYLISLAKEFEQLPGQSREDIALCKSMAERCLKMTARDLDGVPILDYLGSDFLQNTREDSGQEDPGKLKQICKEAFQFVESEYLRFKRLEDRKLALRYYLLLNYFKAKNPFVQSSASEQG